MGHDHHHSTPSDSHATDAAHGHSSHHNEDSRSIGMGLILACVIAGIFAGILAMNRGTSTAPKKADIPAHHLGAADATVVIVEASDFQCPYCARVQPAIHRLVHEYSNDVRLEFRHNPLSFHDQAVPAAAAAVAAARQGRFWEMHSALFRRVNQLNQETILEAAQEIGLDMGKFAEDQKNPSVVALVEQDQVATTTMGARGTPTFFINGLVVKGAQPYPVLRTVVRDQIARANRLKQQGLSAKEAHLALISDQATNPEQYVQLLGTQPLAALGNGAVIQWERSDTRD